MKRKVVEWLALGLLSGAVVAIALPGCATLHGLAKDTRRLSHYVEKATENVMTDNCELQK